MCQLTFVNVGNRNIAKLLLMNQMLANSSTINKDGYGIFQEEGLLFKSEKTPQDIINFGTTINDVVLNNKPILGHVRQATIQTGKKEKEIIKKNSHPFEYPFLILAHNGSLEIEEKNLEVKFKKRIEGKIDSEIFAMVLNDHYSKNLDKPFVEVFNEVNGKFTGKFAFIIYNKYENKWYIVRGLQAKLHITYLTEEEKQIGYIVNTEEKSLENSLNYSLNLIQLVYNRNITYSKPELLDFETIFEVKRDNLYNIGKTKEVIKYSYQSNFYQGNNRHYEHSGRNSGIVVFPQIEDLGKKEAEFILNTMIDFSLSPEELDRMFLINLNTGLNRFTKDDFEIFADTIVPIIEEKFDVEKSKVWRKITSKCYSSVITIYNNYNLLFPYFYNDIKTLEKIAGEKEQ